MAGLIPGNVRAFAARAAERVDAVRLAVVDAFGGVCDTPDRIAARVYIAARVDCPCCTFWRAFALGFTLGAVAAATFAALLFL